MDSIVKSINERKDTGSGDLDTNSNDSDNEWKNVLIYDTIKIGM